MSPSLFPRMHVSLYVSDLDQTIAFYNSFFGQSPVKVKTHYAKYVLEQPSLIISFVEHKDRVQSHFGHLGFQVETPEVMHAALDRMKESGLETREEMGVNCCFAKQDKFWVMDPDGVEWEVYYFHEDAEFNDPRYEMEDQKVQKTAMTEIFSTPVKEPCCAPGEGSSGGKPCC
ncbi:MAG TPA: ArsI/CadI family heavy metal resistance metalloenzyme [Saprospiraceae bacterium]|nr:ArsI/CadI family heavy metal resistance metalloenzyme [Saprospiraceae bacterium]HNT20052.1 ArsI/CadI family heavy metal resistance metalloenzyme [Saprospiraceae bacterium]